MIKMIYDPNNGAPMPDGACDQHARDLISMNELDPDSDHVFSYSTDNIFYTLRVLVKRGSLSCNALKFVFKDNELRVYPSGGVSPWPRGFLDYQENAMIELL